MEATTTATPPSDAGPSVTRDIVGLLSRIDVLVVLDGKPLAEHYATFGLGDQGPTDAYFGLSTFIATLTAGGIFGRFHVTKAHRDTDIRGAADPGMENVRFDRIDLSKYDCIFLFGVAPSGTASSALSDAELAALATFMDGGGGVFATGDHENLGVLMCGQVPRVRSMRKWYFPGPGPLGEPGAPSSVGTMRIDTTQPTGPGTQVQFDNQSDDVPQPITLRYYTWSTSLFSRRIYPHPVLCSSGGAITVLPDHMHEGEVIEPADLGHVFTFGGKSFREYPNGPDGTPVRPEIIAWGKVVPETNLSTEPAAHTGDPLDLAVARSFGVIGAYDGHLAGVGRVVVDSTWHHFFDINLIGDPAAPPGPKQLGFNASPQGQHALEQIKTYYRNIATWIARPARLTSLAAGAALQAATSQPLAMILRPDRTFTATELNHVGALAWDHIVQFVPPCTLVQIVLPPVVVPLLPTPWRPGPPDPGPLIPVEDIARILLGHMVIALGQSRRHLAADPATARDEAGRIAAEAAQAGLGSLASFFGQQAEGFSRLQRTLAGQQVT